MPSECTHSEMRMTSSCGMIVPLSVFSSSTIWVGALEKFGANSESCGRDQGRGSGQCRVVMEMEEKATGCCGLASESRVNKDRVK